MFTYLSALPQISYGGGGVGHECHMHVPPVVTPLQRLINMEVQLSLCYRIGVLQLVIARVQSKWYTKGNQWPIENRNKIILNN